MSGMTNAAPHAIAPYAERSLRRGLDFGASLRWPALAASILLMGAVGATLAQPVLVSWIIDRGVLPQDLDALRPSAFLLLGAVITEAVLTVGHLLLFAWVGERYLARLRSRVFEHLSALPLRFYDAHNTGELIARASDDVQSISGFVRSGLSQLLTGGLLLVLGIAVMGGLSLPLLAVCLLAAPSSGGCPGGSCGRPSLCNAGCGNAMPPPWASSSRASRARGCCNSSDGSEHGRTRWTAIWMSSTGPGCTRSPCATAISRGWSTPGSL